MEIAHWALRSRTQRDIVGRVGAGAAAAAVEEVGVGVDVFEDGDGGGGLGWWVWRRGAGDAEGGDADCGGGAAGWSAVFCWLRMWSGGLAGPGWVGLERWVWVVDGAGLVLRFCPWVGWEGLIGRQCV